MRTANESYALKMNTIVILNLEILISWERNYIFGISRRLALKWYRSCSHSESLMFFRQAKMVKISTISRNCSKSREIKIFFNYLNRILISDKFPFQQCSIFVYFNRSQMNSGGRAPPISSVYSFNVVVYRHFLWKHLEKCQLSNYF